MQSLESVGSYIRHARKAQKLSAITLAQRCGVHRNTLLALETGKGNIELSRLLSICAELGLELLLIPSLVAQQRVGETESIPTELAERLQSLMGSTQ